MLNEKMHRGRLRLILWLGLLLACGLPAQALEAKNVMVIYSASRLLPGNIEFDRAFRPNLQAANPVVRIYDEFLDVSRFPEAVQSRKICQPSASSDRRRRRLGAELCPGKSSAVIP